MPNGNVEPVRTFRILELTMIFVGCNTWENSHMIVPPEWLTPKIFKSWKADGRKFYEQHDASGKAIQTWTMIGLDWFIRRSVEYRLWDKSKKMQTANKYFSRPWNLRHEQIT